MSAHKFWSFFWRALVLAGCVACWFVNSADKQALILSILVTSVFGVWNDVEEILKRMRDKP